MRRYYTAALALGTTLAMGFMASPAFASTGPTYAPGTLVRFNHSSSVFLVGKKTLHWIPSPQVLAYLGYSFSQVKVLPTSEGRPPIGPSVQYFEVKGESLVYWLPNTDKGKVYPLPVPYSPSAHPGMANPPTVPPVQDIQMVPSTSALPGVPSPWPSGVSGIPFKWASNYSSEGLVRVAGQSPVYWFNGQSYHWIPNESIFFAEGYSFKNVSSEAALDRGPIGFPDTLIHKNGDAKVYLLSHGELHWIPSGAALLDMGYRWNEVTDIPTLPAPIGAPIQSVNGVYQMP